MANTGTWKKMTYVKQYCNTPSRKAGYPQPKSYMATQYRTHFLLTDVHLIQNGKQDWANRTVSTDVAIKY